MGWESATADSILNEGESEDKELAIVQYMERTLPLGELGEAPRFVCLQCATVGSAKDGRDVQENGEN